MIVLVLKMLEKLTGAYTKDPDSLIGKLFQLFASALWGVEDTLQVIRLAWDRQRQGHDPGPHGPELRRPEGRSR